MEQLLLYGLGIWLLTRLGKKSSTPAQTPTPKAGRPDLTPQGARVVVTNAVLKGKLPCIDPAGPARLAAVKDLERQLSIVQQLLDDESQRSQPDEAYISQLSNDANLILQQMTNAAVDHANKCEKYFQDFAKRSQTPGQTFAPTTTAPAQRGL